MKQKVNCDIQISNNCKKTLLLPKQTIENNKKRNNGKYICQPCSAKLVARDKYPTPAKQDINIKCDFKVSKKCLIENVTSRQAYLANKKRNNGKYICWPCSYQLKFTGRNNPNCKYKNMNDSFFKNIDSREKAYILGWIISDGHLSNGSITIKIRAKDILILEKIKNIIDPDLKIIQKGKDATFTINSIEMISDLNALGIPTGNKTRNTILPTIDQNLLIDVIRGIFDGDGSLIDPSTNKKRYLRASITSYSHNLINQIKEYINIPCYTSDYSIEWSCNNALDFLGKIYENDNGLHLDRKYNLYRLWCSFVPGLHGRNNTNYICDNKIKCLRINKDAQLPTKVRVSDTGYDLTIIDLKKCIGDVYFYGTGIKVQPDFGWQLEIRSRSSISKTGYMLANGVGTIDRTYLGEIIVPLRKVDKTAPDLELPTKIVQLIPTPVVHLSIEEVNNEEELGESSRSSGGFGSTDV